MLHIHTFIFLYAYSYIERAEVLFRSRTSTLFRSGADQRRHGLRSNSYTLFLALTEPLDVQEADALCDLRWVRTLRSVRPRSSASRLLTGIAIYATNIEFAYRKRYFLSLNRGVGRAQSAISAILASR
jgi:hypothetical protein